MKFFHLFKTLAVLLLFAGLTTTTNLAQDKARAKPRTGPSPETSLVRVNATLQSYNFVRPWEKGAPTPRRGLGAVLEGNRVLVTAELTVNSTYIELEHPATGEKTPAKILGRDYEANLALLGPVENKSKFLAGMKPLPIHTGVKPKDTLEVWQIEDNGDGVTTEVDVLRAAVRNYFVDGASFLVFQVRGSLQARANSFTLPVIKDNKLAGLLLSYSSKEQISQILPGPIIQAFLDDVDDGYYDGFPNVGLSFAQTLDDQLRKFAKINEKEGGVYVRSVSTDGSAEKGGLKEGDIVMAVDGKAIDSRGNYVHPVYGKLNFSHLVRGGAKVGDTKKFSIIRDGKPMDLDVTLERKNPDDYLIAPYMFDRGPRYVIMGGLIFQELTQAYLRSWGEKWDTRAPFKLVHAHAHPEIYEEEGRDKLVFLSQALRTPSTIGYENIGFVIVTKVNDQPIKNIKDLVKAFDKPGENGIHKIEFTDYPKVIYIDDRVARAVNQQLIQYGISQLQRLD